MREPMYRIHYKTSPNIGAWYGGMIPELDNDLDAIVKRVTGFVPGSKVEKIVKADSGEVVWPPQPRYVPLAFYPGDGTRRVVGTAEVHHDGKIFAKIFDLEGELPKQSLKGLFIGQEREDDEEDPEG